ncbi:MAG: RNA ligase RtcB family protein [Planctomycetota bacterium]|nr:RNA ligase RtcB family protein [Planctomycetota bacterium]
MTDLNAGNVRVFASEKNWIEGNALAQLRGTAALPGMRLAVGLPDLHPGKSGPVGAAFVTEDTLYPHLIGNDVGCGMGLWASDLSARKPKFERWERRLVDLDRPWDGDRAGWLAQFDLAPGDQDESLGTIGGGNHFAELQQVEDVEDRAAFAALGLDEDRLVLLVHSGSRGLGREVLAGHMANHGYAGLDAAGDDARAYIARHDHAVAWAQASRALIAWRFLHALGSEARVALDLPHNFVARETLGGCAAWIHRKGANPSNRGALVVPGNRGSFSYLVEPAGPQEANARSVAHGAGRKWNRSDCRARLRERYGEDDLVRTELGSRVICEDRELLYEEAPQAYKKIEAVVGDLVEAGLVRVVAKLRPLITYKVRRAGA